MSTGQRVEVPFLDLKAQFAELREDVLAAVERVFASQAFILGSEGEALEREIADFVGVSEAVGCASGSDAILLALMVLDIKPGDEVVTTPFTFFATAGCVTRLGARPVFVDVEPEGYNLDPTRLEEAITWRTKAILPVHLYGQAADMRAIREIANTHGVPIVEDAAQAIGAEFAGRRAGSLGHMAAFSFFPTKNLGGAGDGGMITTDDVEFAEKARILRNHGMRPKYHYRFVGLNSRLDELQAAVLRVKLARLDGWQSARAENAARYTRLLAEAGLTDVVVPPRTLPERRHAYHQYVVRVPNGERDGLAGFLRESGIGVEVYYPVPLHLQDCYASLGKAEGSFPESERAAREVLALPIYPELTPERIEAVVERMRAYFAR
jgi:dTDP-4-amino-4,6-dideoxygalactose transaminase